MGQGVRRREPPRASLLLVGGGGPGARRRLASANELWDKAHALFAEEESLNLDARQSLVVVFDAIRHHVQQTLVS